MNYKQVLIWKGTLSKSTSVLHSAQKHTTKREF